MKPIYRPIGKQYMLFFLIFSSPVSSGQMFHGFELSANAMNAELIMDNEPLSTQNTWVPRVGYVGENHFEKHFYLGLAGIYMQKGFQYEEEIWELNSFDVPLVLGYGIPFNNRAVKVLLDAGFSLEYHFRAITRIGDTTFPLVRGNQDGEIKSFSSGITLGTGLALSKLITFRINYYHGITNIINSQEAGSWKNRYPGFSLRFFLNKMKS